MDSRGQNRSNEVQEGPDRAEQELDLQPRDLVELLQDVEQVQAEQDPGEPEGDHRDPAEEGAFTPAAEARALDAYEPEETAQNLYNLEYPWDGGYVGAVEPYVGLHRGAGRHCRRRRVLTGETCFNHF